MAKLSVLGVPPAQFWTKEMESRLIPFSPKLNIAAKGRCLAYWEVLDWYPKADCPKPHWRIPFDLLELADLFEKCLKLLPWLQDLHSLGEGGGSQGAVQGRGEARRCFVSSSSVLSGTLTRVPRPCEPGAALASPWSDGFRRAGPTVEWQGLPLRTRFSWARPFCLLLSLPPPHPTQSCFFSTMDSF